MVGTRRGRHSSHRFEHTLTKNPPCYIVTAIAIAVLTSLHGSIPWEAKVERPSF